MRIIAGKWKGLRLDAPQGDVARPTTDRVKESMFHLIGISYDAELVVDLFAGSGALGLEALSRGVDRAVFVDKNQRSLTAVRKNIERLGAKDQAEVLRMDWRAAWAHIAECHQRVGFVFVDPPYHLALWEAVLQTISDSPVCIEGCIVCEHPKSVHLPDIMGRFQCSKTRQYGDIAVTIYMEKSGDVETERTV